MSIDVIGTIYEVFPVQSGIGKSGRPWSNQDIVIEIKEGFNSLRYLKMKVPQRLIDTVASIPQGKECEISFIVESRPFEKNGTKTWFTDVVCMDLRTRLSVSDLQYAPPPARETSRLSHDAFMALNDPETVFAVSAAVFPARPSAVTPRSSISVTAC